MATRGKVIVLVGPKGAGKTTLGGMLEREPDVRFLEVEAIARRVLREMGGIIDERYARRAFEEIARAVGEEAQGSRIVIIETTGASQETPAFLEALRQRHDVKLVRVRARPETCAERIVARDPSRQIDVSAELVRTMHERTEALRLPWDLELDNDPPLSGEQVALALAGLIGAHELELHVGMADEVGCDEGPEEREVDRGRHPQEPARH